MLLGRQLHHNQLFFFSCGASCQLNCFKINSKKTFAFTLHLLSSVSNVFEIVMIILSDLEFSGVFFLNLSDTPHSRLFVCIYMYFIMFKKNFLQIFLSFS